MTDMFMLGAWIVAAESPSIPVELTALAALIGIVWWLTKRADKDDQARDETLREVRKELADQRSLHHIELQQLRTEHAAELEKAKAATEIHRDEKHKVISRLSAALGALAMVKSAATGCTCDALGPVPGLIDQILANAPKEH